MERHLMNGLSRLALLLSLVATVTSCAKKPKVPRTVEEPIAITVPPNGGFEQRGGDGQLPADWEPLVIGAPAQLALDATEKHAGRHSARVSATEVARSYFRSTAVPIAPGEKIHVSAWVKHKDVPPGQGTVILIAEFSDAKGRNESVAKVNTADTTKPSPDWRKIEGTVTAPPLAANLRLRAGFSYSHGTCWWDDVAIAPQQPLV